MTPSRRGADDAGNDTPGGEGASESSSEAVPASPAEGGDPPGGREETRESGEELRAADLEWRDYVAITIGLFRTVLLPFVLIALVLLALFLVSTAL